MECQANQSSPGRFNEDPMLRDQFTRLVTATGGGAVIVW
jgi:hypothetical protein